MTIRTPLPPPRPDEPGSSPRDERFPAHGLPFTAPWLLAPMDGVTDPVFREVVLERNPPECLGGAFTEFVRVAHHKVPARVLRRQLGARRFAAPIGLQLMGSQLEYLAESARELLRTDAPLLDLNFGCPAKGALRGCAGSAVLRDPEQLRRIVRACVDAVEGRVPVTAKIRAGYDDASRVEELAAAAEAGGAALLTVHCRTRAEGYQEEVDWSRIARAVHSVRIPVCGNGSIRTHADLQRMRAETGCRYVMVGRAALGDPWIFSGRAVDAREAATFLRDYARATRAGGATPRGAAARIKQLVRGWQAGGLFEDEARRTRWMRLQSPAELLELVEGLALAGPDAAPGPA